MILSKKEEEYIKIVKAAVRHLNKVKGSSLKVYEITFGLGSNRDYKPNELVTMATVTIQNKEKKKTIKLLFDEATFDASYPWHWDEQANVSRARSDEDKVMLRIAYSIWFQRYRIL